MRLLSRVPRSSPVALCAGAAIASLVACGGDNLTNPPPGGGSSTTSSSTSSTSGSGGGGGGQAGDSVKIVDWNLHNFYDAKQDGEPGEVVVSSSEYQSHLSGAAAILSELAPDIAVFAEVENTDILDAIGDKMGGGYTSTQLPGNDPRGLNIGVLSKIPFTSVVSHKDETFTLAGTPAPTYTFVRDCLELHASVNGRELVLLGVHFRSKGNPDANPPVPDDPDKRLAEGQHVRTIAMNLLAEDPTRAVLVLGDFNDLPGSDVYNWISGSPPNQFIDAADSAPADERFTYTYQGNKELIDHQMMSPTLTPMLTAATIRHGSDVDDVSDHSPILATYSIVAP